MFPRDLFDSNSVADVLGWRVTLIRVQPGTVQEVRFYPSIIQSLRFHYIGRALPCSGEDCPACYAGVGSRQVFYLACADAKDPRHYGLVEISDATMSSLLEAAAGFDSSTKWLAAKLSRRAKNKPVMVDDLQRAAIQSGTLTPKLIMSMLARLYELPMPNSDHADTWRHECRFVLEQRLKRAVATL
jgi:hypothetical protein